MKNHEQMLFPILLIILGIIILSGVKLFGAACLEGAAWKQNVMLTLLLIFGMLPPAVREQRFTFMLFGFLLAFFWKGGANVPGSVKFILDISKILLAVLIIFMGYRLWVETWKINKLYMIAPLCGLIFVGLLFPIEDQNIFGSSVNVIKNWSLAEFTSDKGFHIYLGLAGIAAGITEMLIQTKAPKIVVPSENLISE